jgi:hypothetical protein
MINRKEASAAKPQPKTKAGFTAEAQSSQSFFIFKLLPPRPQRLGVNHPTPPIWRSCLRGEIMFACWIDSLGSTKRTKRAIPPVCAKLYPGFGLVYGLSGLNDLNCLNEKFLRPLRLDHSSHSA